MSRVNGVTVTVGKKKGRTKPNTLKALAHIKIVGWTCAACGARVYSPEDAMHHC